MPELHELLPFCTTDRQREILEAVSQNGADKTALKFGVNRRSIQRVMESIRKRAALRGYSPDHDMTRTVPDGFNVRGVSTYYDRDGKPVGQWVKSGADDERRRQMWIDAADAMAEEMPRLAPSKAPAVKSPELLNLYTLTDCHVGMLAWHRETGANWDLRIAEETLTRCFQMMIDRAPNADTGVIAQLGDWLHQDGLLSVTPTSGHILDADCRFSKMVGASIRIFRRVVDMALAKHKRVILLIAEGNHDLASSVWMRHMFKALYEHEKRIQIIDSEMPYYAYQHGETMLAWHHGHLKKKEQLPLLFAAQYPMVWGSTKHRYCHTGHQHHTDEKEHNGITVHQHPTLAARDAHSARHGYVSERQASAITYHRKFGQVGRVIVTPEMI